MKPSSWISLGAFLAAIGVGLGAFGAHGLPEFLANQSLDAEQLAKRLEWFDTAVRYHMLHAVAIILVGLVAERSATPRFLAGMLFTLGIAIFSGLLYGMALSGARKLGMIVPIGGVAMIAGWLVLAWQACCASRRE